MIRLSRELSVGISERDATNRDSRYLKKNVDPAFFLEMFSLMSLFADKNKQMTKLVRPM
jgi:hypothetical protein